MRALRQITRTLRRWRDDRAGVAVVEFALIVPIMLLIYLGTMEASALISMDRKVQSVSASIGDLTARADKTLPVSQLQDYFRAASGIMTPYSASEVRQMVTAVNVSAEGETSVAWSRQFHGGSFAVSTAYAPGDTYPLPASMIAVAKGRMVIAAEASYSYKPLLGLVFEQAVNLHRSGYFLPRFDGTITLKP